MTTIEHILERYTNISNFLAYHAAKGNAAEVARLQEQYAAAARELVRHLMAYHQIAVEELTSEEQK